MSEAQAAQAMKDAEEAQAAQALQEAEKFVTPNQKSVFQVKAMDKEARPDILRSQCNSTCIQKAKLTFENGR